MPFLSGVNIRSDEQRIQEVGPGLCLLLLFLINESLLDCINPSKSTLSLNVILL